MGEVHGRAPDGFDFGNSPFEISTLDFQGETITLNRIAGLAVGFVGVAILVGFNVNDLGSADSLGELALVGATVSYGFGAVYARAHIHGLRPMIPALFQVGFGLLVVAILAFTVEREDKTHKIRLNRFTIGTNSTDSS